MKFPILQKTLFLLALCVLFVDCKTEENLAPNTTKINNIRIKMVGYCNPCIPNEVNDTVWVEYLYDNENLLIKEKKLNNQNAVNNIPDEVSYEYEGDQIVRVNNFNLDINDKATSYSTYKYNSNGQLSEKRSYYFNVPNEYSNFGKLVYEYENDRLKMSKYILDADGEVDYYTEYDWVDNNLKEFKVISILHDGEERLYYSQSFEYDNNLNPYCLIQNNTTIPLSENNQAKMDALDGGWYHGDLGFEKMIEYNNLELPAKISRELFDQVSSQMINEVVFYEYEEF
jgi:hypothetical protein